MHYLTGQHTPSLFYTTWPLQKFDAGYALFCINVTQVGCSRLAIHMLYGKSLCIYVAFIG